MSVPPHISTPSAITPPHILVVDDDDRLRALLSQYLTDQGYLITMAASAAQAEDLLSLCVFDAMILDVMMPGETGLAFMARKRDVVSGMPVLMLTALGESEDRITGLEAGVADYMAKPFAPRELLLRLQNLIKRSPVPQTKTPTYFRFGPYLFDMETRRLSNEGEPVYLTTNEAECLQHFVAHAGEALSRDTLAGLLGDVTNARSIDVLINRLRKKIEPNPGRPVYLQTIRNAGYQLHGEAICM